MEPLLLILSQVFAWILSLIQEQKCCICVNQVYEQFNFLPSCKSKKKVYKMLSSTTQKLKFNHCFINQRFLARHSYLFSR